MGYILFSIRYKATTSNKSPNERSIEYSLHQNEIVIVIICIRKITDLQPNRMGSDQRDCRSKVKSPSELIVVSESTKPISKHH
jgi:hypothetical protein